MGAENRLPPILGILHITQPNYYPIPGLIQAATGFCMSDTLAGLVGGLGLFIAGMIPTAGALAMILGGCIGTSLLVLIVTLDVKVLALFLVGILGIGLLGAGALTVEQTLMVFYGAGIGSGGLLYLLSSGLAGRSRRIAMYMVLYDVLTSAMLVPLLYVELRFGVPLAMALLERLPFAAEINLAIFYIMTSLFALPLLLGSVNLCAVALKRRWPSSLSDTLARPRFIHETGAGEDPLPRVRQEHARVVENFTAYFDAVREGRRPGKRRRVAARSDRRTRQGKGGCRRLAAGGPRRRGPRAKGTQDPRPVSRCRPPAFTARGRGNAAAE